ncbi:MAG TPA: alpha/beta fold hydrolase [Solirubrobacteraceae bacterium]|nr:alpha/beta fold hydrolase [Solirubrobacteraceae bacterium]
MARIVLVHGAFGRAACWDRVAPGLQAAGHSVEAIDLPGQGDDPTPVAEVTLDRYARRVCEVLADGPPAILVGHSMGGMVITQAAARSPEHIARLVYVAAFLPKDGQSLIDITQLPEGAGDSVQANLAVDGEPPVATFPPEAVREALAHCADDEQAAWAASIRGQQPVVPFTNPVALGGPSADAFAALPRAYVMCLQDRAINPALQRRMLEAGGCDRVIEIDTDHSVWASRPDELAAALTQIAG